MGLEPIFIQTDGRGIPCKSRLGWSWDLHNPTAKLEQVSLEVSSEIMILFERKPTSGLFEGQD